jgi:hypothetical protein
MCLCECNVFPEEICNLQLITLKDSASDETVPIPSLQFLFITPVNAVCVEE